MKHQNYKVCYVADGIEMSFIKYTTEKAISKAIREIVKRLVRAENQAYHTLYVSDNRQEWRGENRKIIRFEIKNIGEEMEEYHPDGFVCLTKTNQQKQDKKQ